VTSTNSSLHPGNCLRVPHSHVTVRTKQETPAPAARPRTAPRLLSGLPAPFRPAERRPTSAPEKTGLLGRRTRSSPAHRKSVCPQKGGGRTRTFILPSGGSRWAPHPTDNPRCLRAKSAPEPQPPGARRGARRGRKWAGPLPGASRLAASGGGSCQTEAAARFRRAPPQSASCGLVRPRCHVGLCGRCRRRRRRRHRRRSWEFSAVARVPGQRPAQA
jgi:hypothetical protein